MNFLDLFAGIGGFRMGMEMAGHKCVGYVEIDKFARKSYEAIFDTKGEWTAHDIRTVSDDDLRLFRGKVDVICGGFPCQPFSIAAVGEGKRMGFRDTRGTLFFEIARFAKEIQPRYLFLENVKGLLSHDKGRTFETILLTLDELGYDAEWCVLNSKDFGIPQDRKRVFIIGHHRGNSKREFVFPKLVSFHEESVRYKKGEVAATLTTRVINRWNCNAVITKNGLRYLTPREAWRLQGFPDWAFDRAKAAVVSDSQLYKQAGNSVSVPVIYEIAKRMGFDD
jgi:DNA (cytosine-5)-methyltransferase 1